MPNKDKNIPKRRFKEFENADAWELHPLREIGNTYTGLSGKTKDDFGHGDGRFVTYMNVFSNPISLPEMVEEVEFDESQNIVRYGDVLFTTSSETPEEVGMSSVWLENTENTYLNSFCFGFRPVKKVNPYYLAYLLRSSGMRRKISFLAQGISRYNISKTKMMELEISIPNENEQSAIGTFFSTLDQHITLHQRKLDKLKSVKQAYLSEMFPAEGERVPKRRFPGFTDDWEQRKLGDTVIEIIAGGDIDKNKVVEFGKYPIYANSHSGDGIVAYYDDFYRVNGPAVTVTGRGEVGFAKARETDFTPVVRLLAIRSKHNHYFLENAINLHGVTVESTGVPQLTVPQLSAYRIYFPYDIQEENQIGTFFSTLDRHITLHQRKLEKLKNLKKALLNELFV
ncbi:restriction endonuclease subunit S [Streptococcus parasuis]|uniref:restriction endonuclease subunit S n=1 Tax=Streptococcus parasuis TaxID=1501662 RepID=UPI00370CFFC0